MNREEFELVLETVFEAVHEELISPLMKTSDALFIELTAGDAVDSDKLCKRLAQTREDMSDQEKESIGGRWLARLLLIAEAGARGEEPEAVLRKLHRTEPIRPAWFRGVIHGKQNE